MPERVMQMGNNARLSRSMLAGLTAAVMVCSVNGCGGARAERFLFFPRLFIGSASEDTGEEEISYSFKLAEIFKDAAEYFHLF